MCKQTKEIRLTEGNLFPDNANPGDIHIMDIVDDNDMFEPYWEIYVKWWRFDADWCLIETIYDADTIPPIRNVLCTNKFVK